MQRLLTSKDLLVSLGISQKTLGRHLSRGLLPQPIRVGRRRYWRVDQVEAALASLHAQPTTGFQSQEAGDVRAI
jgi:predicted DNA-binding transcriptional regulator AlpA